MSSLKRDTGTCEKIVKKVMENVLWDGYNFHHSQKDTSLSREMRKACLSVTENGGFLLPLGVNE